MTTDDDSIPRPPITLNSNVPLAIHRATGAPLSDRRNGPPETSNSRAALVPGRFCERQKTC